MGSDENKFIGGDKNLSEKDGLDFKIIKTVKTIKFVLTVFIIYLIKGLHLLV